MKNQRMKRGLSLLFVVMFAIMTFLGASPKAYASSAAATASSFQIDFIDVGQGDASLVQCDGHYMLIDGGTAKKSDLIYAYLKQRSINNLDVIVATHADADHVGGLAGALNYATVGVAYCSVTESDTKAFRSFLKYLSAQGKTITVPEAGDNFFLGSAQVTILGPTATAKEDNNNSIVLQIVYGKTSFLFTGDAENEEEQAILTSKRSLSSTVLKVAHHGSKSSTGYQFLRQVSPLYAVISVGRDNSYGHPTEETLSRLRDADVKVFRTDMQGHIICTSDGKNVAFAPQKNANADTLAGAGAGQRSSQTGITVTVQPTTIDNTSAEATDRSIPAQSEDLSASAQEQPVAQETTPTEQTYILNTNTHKFHYPECKSVGQMKEKNKETYTGSRDEIIARGYSPCGNCHP